VDAPHLAVKTFLLCVVAAGALACTGCLSTKYKLEKTATQPIPFNLTAPTDPALPLEATLHTIIVMHGPGSWKREAFWDEYVVSLANRGAAPVAIESVTLTDFQAQAIAPGDDPWALESATKTWWEKTKDSQVGNLVVLGVGAVSLATTLAIASIAADGGILAPATAAGSLLGTAAAVTLVATPIYAVTVVAINFHNKKEVATEFNRRRLALPRTLAPGELAQGSLFFRLAPGPQRLVLHCRVNDAPRDIMLELGPLSGLHLKTSAPTAQTAPSASPSS